MDHIPWVEKYRPQDFSEIILQRHNELIFKTMLEKNIIPDLLFYGPPGTGKTTTIINLIDSYQVNNNQKHPELIVHLNASDDRGIDIIRNQINTFTTGVHSQMNSLIRLAFLPTASIKSTASLIAKVTKRSMILCLCLAGMTGLVFQAHAANQDAGSGQVAGSGKYDFSKVPPVTPMPRPGLFAAPPSGPGYYSVWDLITGSKRENRPARPYAPFALMPTSAFDVDFRYLENPEHEKDIFDPVKRIHMGSDWLLSFGGSFWYRYVHETDSRLNAAGTNNDFHLLRTRVHADLWYQDRIRLFAEFLDARSFGSELTPLGIERNHTDMLNLFADIKLADVNDPDD